jgi:hypothetical protein
MRMATRLMELAGVDDALVGDLIEMVAGRGHVWLWRQVLGAIAATVLNRMSAERSTFLFWSLVVFASAASRLVADTFAPPSDYGFRSALTTYVAMSICLVTGFSGAFKTASLRSGVWLATLTRLTGHLLTVAFTLALFLMVIRQDPAKLREFRTAGGFSETLFLPLIVLPLVTILGLVGAAGGRLARRRLP